MAIAMMVPGGIRRNQFIVVLAHLAGAALGGACVGLVLGAIGSEVGLARFSVPILVLTAAAIALASRRRPGRSYGIGCQVPREWGRARTSYGVFFGWGSLLGSGLATLVPYPAFFLVPIVESLLAVQNAVLVGFVFGLAREGVVAWPLLFQRSPSDAMNLLPTMGRIGRLVNFSLPGLVVAALTAYSLTT